MRAADAFIDVTRAQRGGVTCPNQPDRVACPFRDRRGMRRSHLEGFAQRFDPVMVVV